MKDIFYYKVKKFRTIDITFLGLMLSIYVVFDLISGYAIIILNSTVINLKFIPLFMTATYTDWFRTFILAVISGIVSFFLPSNLDSWSIPAYTFDYFIPVLLTVFASFFIPRNQENKIRYYIVWVVILVFTCIGFWLSRTVGGYFWFLAGQVPNGSTNIWIFSLGFNIVNASADLLLFILVIPGTCMLLKKPAERIY